MWYGCLEAMANKEKQGGDLFTCSLQGGDGDRYFIDENCGLLYKALIDQGVADALAARDVDRSMNGDDSHNSGTGVRRQAPLAHECTYPDFIKCKPLYFKGTKGVVELTQWFERMETDVGHDVAYAMTWTNLKKMMTDKYCPRGEIKKLEVEMWNLKVKGNYVVGYNQRFQELTLMCARMFPEESDKIEKYISALPDMIHESVMAYKPKTMQDAIEFATKLMDKKISTLVERQAENKRKLDNINQAQQQPPKKQGVAIAYTAGSSKRKESPAATNNQRNLTCYECGNQGHYRSDCPELKNQNHGNQAGGTRASGMVHALKGGETNQDLNDMEDDINA
ncbi:reverse transcriptase domain-containing protein [Tanacetum coccineum]